MEPERGQREGSNAGRDARRAPPGARSCRKESTFVVYVVVCATLCVVCRYALDFQRKA